MARRVCLEPGCPKLTDSPRCPAHTRAQDKARGSRHARGYDAGHTRRRAAWQARMDAGEVVYCWRDQRPDLTAWPCLTPGVPVDPSDWHLGHDDTDRAVTRGPEHPGCNLPTAGRR